MDGKTPGDGKTSPFGKNGGPMAGNDFIKNPAGAAPGSGGNNFIERPQGAGPSAPTPTDFTKGGAGAQRSGSDPANPESTTSANSGPGNRPDAVVPPGSPRQALIGVGSIGDSRKPFKGI